MMSSDRFHTFSAGLTMLLLLALGLGWYSDAEALMVPLSIDTIAASSSHIVRGEVVSAESQWDSSHSYIYTNIKLRVRDRYKGACTDTINIVVPGGVVGETGLFVEHAAELKLGEDVVVFLSQAGVVFDVTAYEQGKYTIASGRVTEKNMLLNEFIELVKAAALR